MEKHNTSKNWMVKTLQINGAPRSPRKMENKEQTPKQMDDKEKIATKNGKT